MGGLTSSNPGTWLPIDGISGNRLMIGIEHGTIHAGRHFVAHYTETVGAASAVTVMLTTPSSPTFIHLIADVEMDNSGSWTFSEAPNATGGSAVVSNNNRRSSANTSGTVVVSNVTYTSSGTVLDSFINGSDGAGPSGAGGDSGHENEWLLAANTAYLIRATVDNADTKVTVRIPYYYGTAS